MDRTHTTSADNVDFEKGIAFIEECAALAPTDEYNYTLWAMAGMHSALFRGLKSIEDQLEVDHSADMANWIGYCGCFTHILIVHHTGEEETLFPVIEKELDMKSNVDQHHAFLPLIKALDDYLTSCLADHSKWSAAMVRQHIDGFKAPMMYHLVDELRTLHPDTLKAKCSEKILKEADEHHMSWIQKNSDPFRDLLFITTHNNPAKEHNWPPLPFVPKKLLIPTIFKWKHSGYWKYAPHAIQN